MAGAAGLGPLKMAICKQAITANAKWVHSDLLVPFKWESSIKVRNLKTFFVFYRR